MAKTQYYGTGRRKSSVARVRLVPGTGNITVNKKSLDDYLAMEIVKREVKRPFELLLKQHFGISAQIEFKNDEELYAKERASFKEAEVQNGI